MGVACGDFDGDGRLDLAVTNFFGESTTLYHNHGGGFFSDRTAAAGLAAPTRFVLGFGLVALDANNDGRLDLAQANGHVGRLSPLDPLCDARAALPGRRHRQVPRRLAVAPALPGRTPRLARGLAAGDVDNDGLIDVARRRRERTAGAIFHQRNGPDRKPRPLHRLRARGDRSPTAMASVLWWSITTGEQTQVRPRFGGGSYLSASDHRLHFGLGNAAKVDRVVVTWPSGRTDEYHDLAADTGYTLREGEPLPSPLAGFARRAGESTHSRLSRTAELGHRAPSMGTQSRKPESTKSRKKLTTALRTPPDSERSHRSDRPL